MRLPGGAGPPSLLAFAPHQGLVVAHSQADLSLHSITINGRHRLAWECTERLSALVVSPDGRFVLTGGAKGVITLMWLHSFQVSVCIFYNPDLKCKIMCNSGLPRPWVGIHHSRDRSASVRPSSLALQHAQGCH